jgi:hypothetical protein
MRNALTNVPELAEYPGLSDQVMAMLATDPDERPRVVANWVGQLRRSSLEGGPDILSPAAPQRNPTGPVDRKTRRTIRRVVRRPIVLAIGLAIIGAGVVSGLLDLDGPATTVTVAKPNYQFTPINNPDDPTFNRLMGINNSDVIAGYYGNGSSGHPNQGYLVSEPTEKPAFTPKNYPDSVQTQVTAINSANDVAGCFVNPEGIESIFVEWQGSFGSYKDPGTPHVTGSVRLLGINKQGIAVGFYKDASGNSHAFTLNQAGNTYVPITAPGGTSTVATGINNGGELVGFTTSSGMTSSFLQLPNGNLYSFQFPGGKDTRAMGMNDKDQIVGSYLDRSGLMHGFVLSEPTGPHSVWQSINDPKGIGSTDVNGINDHGDLVGGYTDSSGNTHGFFAK